MSTEPEPTNLTDDYRVIRRCVWLAKRAQKYEPAPWMALADLLAVNLRIGIEANLFPRLDYLITTLAWAILRVMHFDNDDAVVNFSGALAQQMIRYRGQKALLATPAGRAGQLAEAGAGSVFTTRWTSRT